MSDGALLSLGSMEGLAEPAPGRRKDELWPGYLAAGLTAAIAYMVHFLPFAPFLVEGRHPLSASMIALAVAAGVRNLFPVPKAVLVGCKHIVRTVIPVSVMITGAGMDLGRAAGTGLTVLVIVLLSMFAATASAIWFGRWFGLSRKTSALIGAGTAVCGTSAIVAAAPLAGAEDEDLTLAVSSVSLLGLVLMFLLPAAGSWLGLSQEHFGVWAGTAIHAVPQAAAAGFTYGNEAGSLAMLVKLTRVALLAPFLLCLTLVLGREEGSRICLRKLVPGFLWGFLLLSVFHTLRLLPVLSWDHYSAKLPLSEVANWLLTLAMAAIGLEVNLKLLLRAGGMALAAGGAAAAVLCATSLWLIRILL